MVIGLRLNSVCIHNNPLLTYRLRKFNKFHLTQAAPSTKFTEIASLFITNGAIILILIVVLYTSRERININIMFKAPNDYMFLLLLTNSDQIYFFFIYELFSISNMCCRPSSFAIISWRLRKMVKKYYYKYCTSIHKIFIRSCG